MWHRNRPHQSSLIGALLLTLFIHFLGLIYLGTPSVPKNRSTSPQRVQILSQQDVQKILNRRPQVALKRKKKVKPPKPPEPKMVGQVVYTPPPKKEEVPEKAQFLSSFDRAVAGLPSCPCEAPALPLSSSPPLFHVSLWSF